MEKTQVSKVAHQSLEATDFANLPEELARVGDEPALVLVDGKPVGHFVPLTEAEARLQPASDKQMDEALKVLREEPHASVLDELADR